MFEVGDLIKGLPEAPYGITDKKMTVGVVVPYNTDGKIRCSRAQIIEVVE